MSSASSIAILFLMKFILEGVSDSGSSESVVWTFKRVREQLGRTFDFSNLFLRYVRVRLVLRS